MAWVERIEWVNLVHISLKGNEEQQQRQAERMSSWFDHLEYDRVAKIAFPEAVRHAKSFFTNVPKKTMRPSLVSFMERTLNYLSAGVVLGVRTSLGAMFCRAVVNCFHVLLC